MDIKLKRRRSCRKWSRWLAVVQLARPRVAKIIRGKKRRRKEPVVIVKPWLKAKGKRGR